MKNRNSTTKCRVLRVRPGLLANFSGGAGYMPFIAMATAPLSLILAVISHLTLYGVTRGRLGRNSSGSPVDLAALQKRVWTHTTVCLGIAIPVSAFFLVAATGMVYGDKTQYLPATLLMTTGPFIAWILSTLLLGSLVIRSGSRWYHPILAILAHVLMVVGCVVLGYTLATA